MIGAFVGALLALSVASGQQAPQGLDAAYAPIRVALVVGIDEYADSALQGLKFPAKDAKDMAGVLGDDGAGGFDSVTLLSGEVSRDEFWAAFNDATADLGRDDLFVLFLAGHGTLGPSGNASSALYFLPSDTSLQRYDLTGIAMDDVAQAMDDVEARRRVLMVDACHSGTGRSSLSSEVVAWLNALRGPPPGPTPRSFSKYEARLFAADFNQPAREDDALQNGVYTHFLIEGLRGAADLDADGLVSVLELHEHVAARTMQHTGGAQVPRVETSRVGSGSLFLAGDPGSRVDAENAILTGLAGLPDGVDVQVDGASRGAILPPGRYRVTLQDADELLVDTPVRFRAGQATDIRGLLQDRRARWNVGFGVGWARSAWTPALAADFDLQWQPRDPGGGRTVFGLAVSTGDGELKDLGHATAVSTVASVGYRQGAALGWAPVVGLGFTGRQLGPYLQGAPLMGLGMRLDAQTRAGFAALRSEFRVAPSTAGLALMPSVTLVLGPSARP